jgi:hypothetical protein
MRSMLPRKLASVLVRVAAHDPATCERFGDNIMRPFNKMGARSRDKRRRLSGKTGFRRARACAAPQKC